MSATTKAKDHVKLYGTFNGVHAELDYDKHMPSKIRLDYSNGRVDYRVDGNFSVMDSELALHLPYLRIINNEKNLQSDYILVIDTKEKQVHGLIREMEMFGKGYRELPLNKAESFLPYVKEMPNALSLMSQIKGGKEGTKELSDEQKWEIESAIRWTYSAMAMFVVMIGTGDKKEGTINLEALPELLKIHRFG
ncbi:MAG: hypothetical protein KGH71_01375 [Candidatus Micrarchaeota archaeon]|nr:hypothetical protein [Candidatus Micrarchaeota archaeon]